MNTDTSMWTWSHPTEDIPSLAIIAVGVLLILGLSEIFKKKGFSKE